ncbi:MAG: DUF929 family protein [Candidatus Dormibacteria bacterium]
MSKKSMAARRQMARTEPRPGAARQAGAGRHQGRGYRRDARGQRRPWGLISAILGVVAVFVVVVLVAENTLNGNLTQDTTVTPASPALMHSVTSIPASTIEAPAGGTVSNYPLRIPATYKAQALTSHGLPEVLYVGAEYCPYCAVQRWSLIVALSRFGTWSNMHTIRSSVYETGLASLPTFTFAHGGTYTSPYVAFVGREYQSNVSLHHDGSPYARLQNLNTTEAKAFSGIDPQGGYPFVDFGGKTVTLGSPWGDADVAALDGLTWSQVASHLHDPSSHVAKDILGGANYDTAAICQLTGDKPGKVCGGATIQALESKIQASS